ncbi:MAG: hypothetical protein ACYC8T_19135 [Myxococcaceae bacterium]
MLTTFAVAMVMAGAPKAPPALVGTWLAGGTAFVTFSANGTGRMDEANIKWSADGKTITVVDDEGGTDRVAYQLSGDNLTVSMGGVPLTLTRKKGKVAAKLERANQVSEEEADAEAMAEAEAWIARNGAGAGAAPAKAAPARGAAGGDRLSQLLMSSAWCSFKYNQISGASSSTRVQFGRNGTWSTSRRAETYNSGAAGTVAGQYDSGGDGQWAVRQGTLWMSFPPEQPQLGPVEGFAVTQNSNGYPIIRGNGQEWSQCN